MQGEGSCDNEYTWHLDVEEGEDTHKLSLNDRTDVGKACLEVMHGTGGGACGDSVAGLAEVPHCCAA